MFINFFNCLMTIRGHRFYHSPNIYITHNDVFSIVKTYTNCRRMYHNIGEVNVVNFFALKLMPRTVAFSDFNK